jgi:glutamyl/glutaminyl-tRNA synthetase
MQACGRPNFGASRIARGVYIIIVVRLPDSWGQVWGARRNCGDFNGACRGEMFDYSTTGTLPRTRFAPSPTGYLHLGHVAHALFVWGLGRAMGAEVLLRIEDHDRGRCRPEFEYSLLEDLEWLGFAWDGAVTRQSEREPIYTEAAEHLRGEGLLYACECTRRQILARAPQEDAIELRYDNHCGPRGLVLSSGAGWRCRLPDESVAFHDLRLGGQQQRPQAQCGDLLVRDRHGNWTYQFAVTVDDMVQGVNRVIRGEDLLASTARQLSLARLLGREDAPSFYHHPLIMDGSTDAKLSKRDLAHAVREERLAGQPPEITLSLAAHAVGLKHDKAVEEMSSLLGRVASLFMAEAKEKLPINP